MPDATCTPGQDGLMAIAPAAVILRPTNGKFPVNVGQVELISNDNHVPAAMGVIKWDEDMIEAQLPWPSPGTGQVTELFTVEAKSNGTTYRASPVRVEGPVGSGYPPTHPPT